MLESHSAETLHGGGLHHRPSDQRIAFRPATAADVDAYFGERPRQTLKAIILTLDDEPACIVGLAKEDGFYKAFSEYKPQFKPHLRSMTTLRAIKAFDRMLRSARLPVVAVSHPDEPESPNILRRLGFEFHDESEEGDIYEYGISR